MVCANFGFSLTNYMQKISGQYTTLDYIKPIIIKIDQSIRHAGWVVGLENRWRMFSLRVRSNWYMNISILRQDGTKEKVLVPFSYGVHRNFWQRNITDFREDKFQVNIYNSVQGKSLYAKYLCRKYHQKENPVVLVEYKVDFQDIPSPEKTKVEGYYQDRQFFPDYLGNFECPEL